MNYEITTSENDTLIKARVKCVPENKIISSFFSGIKIRNYPKLINLSLAKIGFFDDIAGTTFKGDLDPSDEPMPDNMIRLTHNFIGDTIVSEEIYFTMLSDLSEKLLECNQKTQPYDGWVNEMEDAISKIKVG